MNRRTKYEIQVETDNPSFIKRLKEALNQVGLDLDDNNQARYLNLDVTVDSGGVPTFRYGTTFDPYDQDYDGSAPHGRGLRVVEQAGPDTEEDQCSQ